MKMKKWLQKTTDPLIIRLVFCDYVYCKLIKDDNLDHRDDRCA